MIEQYRFDLGREHIDPANNHHVVTASHRLAHLDMGAATGARLAVQHANVAGAVPQQRERLFGDAGEHQLAFLPLRQDFSSLWVDDLRNEMILIDMHTGLRLALERNTRSGNLGQAIDIIRPYPQLFLNVPAHLLAPCLRAENACFQADLIWTNPHFCKRLTDKRGIGRRTAEDGRLKILDKLDLTLGVAGGHRQGQAADFMRSTIQPGASGKQPVTIRNLHDIFFTPACRHNRPGTAVLPEVDVRLGIERDHPFSGGTTGRLDAHRVFERNRQKAIWVSVPQVALGQERQLIKVIRGFDVGGGQLFFLHLLTIVWLTVSTSRSSCHALICSRDARSISG